MMPLNQGYAHLTKQLECISSFSIFWKVFVKFTRFLPQMFSGVLCEAIQLTVWT